MSYRLRGGLQSMLRPLRELLLRRRAVPVSPRLRGRARQVIVVTAPDALFSEAVFILRDELLRQPGLDRETLLLQASQAAESCTAEALPERTPAGLRPAAAFLLGSAGTLLLLWGLGFL